MKVAKDSRHYLLYEYLTKLFKMEFADRGNWLMAGWLAISHRGLYHEDRPEAGFAEAASLTYWPLVVLGALVVFFEFCLGWFWIIGLHIYVGSRYLIEKIMEPLFRKAKG